MEKLVSDADISTMDIFHAKQLRKELSRRISKIRSKDTIRIQTTISAEKKLALQLTVNWLYDNKLIKSKSRYAFLQFAVENTMKQVLDQIKEDELKQQLRNDQNSLKEPVITGKNYVEINSG
ncbi:MAG: hypothetical protein E4G94_00595 [ANME-2 cluster archaeon]|nr:MAG: hypothetical protein E4G94_00595 [ANME-2 cluster archaeon]